MGAAFYDDEGCILCGLCIASTSEEMVAATKKIRAYLRSQPVKWQGVRKIAICGKGGTGKSTIASLISRALAERNFSVLVIDTDESNPGLYRMLGFQQEPKPIMSLLSRFVPDEPSPDIAWFNRDEILVPEIPAKFVLRGDGIKFLAAGKIEEPLQGCACSIADLTRDLVMKLRLNENEMLVIDAEAGIESFGRGVERSVDTVLIIVEPSFESIALAKKISYMAQGIGVRTVKAVLNKMPSEDIRKRTIEALIQRGVSQIGTINYDPAIAAAGFEGKPPGDSRAREEVNEIVTRLLSEGAQS